MTTVVLDTNVVVAGILAKKRESLNRRLYDMVVNDSLAAYTCDALRGEVERIFRDDDELVAKAREADQRMGDVLRILQNLQPNYVRAKIDEFFDHVTYVQTKHLTVEEGVIKRLGNDWYLIAIAIERKANYIITWESAVIDIAREKYSDAPFVALSPPDFFDRERSS